MLEYDIDEAQALLEKNQSTATRNLETLEDDLDFLRDQFTTTEVSILPLCGVDSKLCFCFIYCMKSLCWKGFIVEEHLMQSKVETSAGQSLVVHLRQ